MTNPAVAARVAKLIADRGHGMSRRQADALRWVATQGEQGRAPRRVETWVVLQSHGLVVHDPDKVGPAAYALTPTGWTLARRMGIDVSEVCTVPDAPPMPWPAEGACCRRCGEPVWEVGGGSTPRRVEHAPKAEVPR